MSPSGPLLAITVTYAVVVFSIVVQGLTLARVLRRRRAQPSKPGRP